MKKSRLAVLAVAPVAALLLTSCAASDNAGYNDSGFTVQTVATPGGSVTCVLYDGYDGDSISCDWGNPR